MRNRFSLSLLQVGLLCSPFLLSPVRAQLGSGFRPLENLIIHPYVETGFEYDSEAQLVNASSSELFDEQARQSDTSFRVRPGVDVLHVLPQQTIRTEIWGDLGRSLESSDLDEDAYGYQQSLRGGGETTSYSVLHGFQHAVDGQTRSNFEQDSLAPAEDIRDRSERDLYNLSLELGHQFAVNVTRRTASIVQADTVYGYDHSDFHDEARSDIDTHNGGLQFSAGVSHTAAAQIDYRIATEDSDDFDERSLSHTLLAGYRDRYGERITWRILAGYQQFEPAVSGSDPDGGEILADPDSLEGFSYRAEVSGQIDPQLSLLFSAENGVETASFGGGANPRTVDTASLALAHRTTERLSLALTGSFRNDDLENPVQRSQGPVDADTQAWSGGLSATYLPYAWMNGVAKIGYEMREGNLPADDLDRLTLSIRVRITY